MESWIHQIIEGNSVSTYSSVCGSLEYMLEEGYFCPTASTYFFESDGYGCVLVVNNVIQEIVLEDDDNRDYLIELFQEMGGVLKY